MTPPQNLEQKAREIVKKFLPLNVSYQGVDESGLTITIEEAIAAALTEAHAQGAQSVLERIPKEQHVHDSSIKYGNQGIGDPGDGNQRKDLDWESGFIYGARWCAAKITEK
jgi:hypothetical protein